MKIQQAGRYLNKLLNVLNRNKYEREDVSYMREYKGLTCQHRITEGEIENEVIFEKNYYNFSELKKIKMYIQDL